MLTAKAPMDLQRSVVCITGGSDGIGLGLAKRFVQRGSTVVVTGRRADALQKAKDSVPELHTFQGDVGKVADREKLVEALLKDFPTLNIFCSNAGMVRNVTANQETASWAERQVEIAVNLEAPVHFMQLLTPHFLQQPEAAFINTTSGLGFSPCAMAPMYGATKAALHSFTMASRWAYENTKIRLVEIAPPLVKTKMSVSGMGEDLDVFCDHVFNRFAAGELEVGFGSSEMRRLADRETLDKYYYDIAQKGKVPKFE